MPSAPCALVTEAPCLSQAGTYLGDGALCEATSCPASAIQTGIDAAGVPVLLAVPNPSRRAVRIQYRARVSAPIRLEIRDAGGRIVRRLEERPGGNGRGEWTWDGLDSRGHRAPSGVYQARIEGSAGGGTTKLLLMR